MDTYLSGFARTRRLVAVPIRWKRFAQQWEVSNAWKRRSLGPIYAMSSGSYWTDGATRWSTRWRCSRGMLERDFRKHVSTWTETAVR
ncbi:hypothetical protein PI126_g20358 [Phytophthora idaei]|nr:hypothetical protein PI126_g20358 [Phytophthora idaei]